MSKFFSIAHIREFVGINSELLSRFRQLAKESEYLYTLSYNDFNISLIMKSSISMTQLFQLNLSDALVDIFEGNINSGLDKLVLARRWIDLHYMDKSEPSSLHFIVAINFTQYLDQVVDALLSSEYLEDYLNDSRVKTIVRPYSKLIGQKLNESMISSMFRDFKNIDYPYIKYYVSDKIDKHLTEEEEYIILLYFREYEAKLPPELLKTLQILDKKSVTQQWIKAKQLKKLQKTIYTEMGNEPDDLLLLLRDRLTDNGSFRPSKKQIVEWYKNFFHDIKMTPQQALTYMNMKYSSADIFNDYYTFLTAIRAHNSGPTAIKFTDQLLKDIVQKTIRPAYQAEVLAMLDSIEFEMYWCRLYAQQNYHQLVYLKYLIKKNKIEKENIIEYLDTLGELSINSLTGEPYSYNIKNHLLLTPLPLSSQHLPSSIRQARRDDKRIKYFSVRIP